MDFKKVTIVFIKMEYLKKINSMKSKIKSIYNLEKLINLFNNSDTFSFVEILLYFKNMLIKVTTSSLKRKHTLTNDVAFLFIYDDCPSFHFNFTYNEKF